MAVLPLNIKTTFGDKRVVYLIKDELSDTSGYTTIYIDKEDGLWFQEKEAFIAFREAPMTIIYELYVHLVYLDDVLSVLREMDMRTAVETYIKIVYGNFLQEPEIS